MRDKFSRKEMKDAIKKINNNKEFKKFTIRINFKNLNNIKHLGLCTPKKIPQ